MRSFAPISALIAFAACSQSASSTTADAAADTAIANDLMTADAASSDTAIVPRDVVADVPIEVACTPAPVATVMGCPSCLAGRWWALGTVPGFPSSGFLLEFSGCASTLRCRLGGAEHHCFFESRNLRIDVDSAGFQELFFDVSAGDCTRLTGSYISEGGSPTSVRADHLDDGDAGVADSGYCPVTDASVRSAPCGPCGARLVTTDAGVQACERLTNPCGGCNPGVERPGASCGAGHYYYCYGPDMQTCAMGAATDLNACGWTMGTLTHQPGDPCGTERECRWVCDRLAAGTSGDVTCWCPPAGDAGM